MTRRPDDYISPVFSTVITQPTTLCNLDCFYCYLPDRKRRKDMTPAVAGQIARSIEAQAGTHTVSVVWHGGEPLALPREQFVALLAPFEELQAQGLVRHSVQTNATLITPAWCEVLAGYEFEVGVSVDGAAAANLNRVDRSGRPAFGVRRFMAGVEYLRQAGIPFTTICVVSPQTIADPDGLVGFFEELGCTAVGFNIEEQEGANQLRQVVREEQAELFWQQLIRRRLGGSPLRVRELDRLFHYLAQRRTGQPDDFTIKFDPIPTVAYNGDTVVLSPELLGMRSAKHQNFVVGNVLEKLLPDMLAGINNISYAREFARGLNGCQSECPIFGFCRGAQAGNRYFETGSFATIETAYCRNTRQALVKALRTTIKEESS